MKATFYSILAILVLTSATCRKNHPGISLEKDLIGEWRYLGKSGGFAGKSEKADSANTYVLEFKNGYNYKQKTNDQISSQGTYELYKVKSIFSGKEDNAIRFNSTSNHLNKSNIISLRNDTLIITDNVYDGFKVEYIRIYH